MIEADKLKMSDPVFQELNSRENQDAEIARVVHSYSTNAANEQLIAGLSSGCDIVMDGTLTWSPYVEATISMARNAHLYSYSLGRGWVPEEEIEEYWVQGAPLQPPTDGIERLPYQIEILGVTTAAALAVGRGLRRKLVTGRGVPVSAQLRSHRMFSENFEKYLPLVDRAYLYDTTDSKAHLLVSYDDARTDSPMMIFRDGRYAEFCRKKHLNIHANCAAALFTPGKGEEAGTEKGKGEGKGEDKGEGEGGATRSAHGVSLQQEEVAAPSWLSPDVAVRALRAMIVL